MYAVVPTIPISFPKRILLDSLDDPISKLPFDVMRSLSRPPVSAVIVSALGNLNDVLVSPR